MGIAFQIVLCGVFFALCLSDVLDIKSNFSAVRFILNIFYALVFLSLTSFALSGLHQKKQKHIQMIVCFSAALIAVQCFVVIENPAFDAGFHRRYAFDQKSSIA